MAEERIPFCEALERRILILDGAMGTMVQALGCQSENTDELNLSQPSLIGTILRQYAEVGADIITTNSFGCNALVQRRHNRSEDAPTMALAAARLARRAADEEYARRLASGENRPVYVAGSIGPTGLSLTMATDASDPSLRESDFLSFKEAAKAQIAALVEGGVDLIQLETCFDALNTKAAICALEELGCSLPVIISATVSDRSGRMLTGQTLEAFYHSVRHCPHLAAFGLNCALGAAAMRPLVEEVARFSDLPLVFYPNAGIPDEMGRYNESPEEMAAVMRSLAEEGLLNIAGGCCGTTPAHIRALTGALSGMKPRVPGSAEQQVLTVSGLEAYRVDASVNFTNVGERANVTGSRKFARLIASGDYEQALSVAAAQVAGGANIIDVNMDDAMLDSKACMRTFLRYVASDPAVASAAVMIDSSHWDTLVEGLQNTPGRSIVNSISLKDGEEEFLRRARIIRSYGAVPIVMAFDEEGQAVTFERKISIAERAYRLLTQKAGYRPCDIIFDLNILSIGTGIPEHARFAIDFIEGVRWVKQHLPGALTSGGVSNLSFAFRGNNAVREAMHSAFLYHAIKAGLDMAIVNPQMLQLYDEVEPHLLRAIEDVIFDRDEDATARLTDLASQLLQDAAAGASGAAVGGVAGGGSAGGSVSGSACGASVGTLAGSSDGAITASERLQQAIIRGNNATLTEDTLAELERLGSAVAVVEGPLMQAMARVGERFAEGKMFLPQVVKSAKVMRQAVQVLEPYMGQPASNTVETDGQNSSLSDPAANPILPGSARASIRKPRFVIATIRGDVHDIGKNITSIVLQCGGFEVFDMGVMVPCEDILAKAREVQADIIGVSGLITPSLYRMEELCQMMAREGFTTPLFVGGAAASAIHTAVKLAPLYPDVHYGADASVTAVMAKKYLSDPAAFRAEEEALHQRLRALHTQGASASGVGTGAPDASANARIGPETATSTLPAEGQSSQAAAASVQPPVSPDATDDAATATSPLPPDAFADIPLRELSIDELRSLFDWRLFDLAYGIKNSASAEAAALSAQARSQAEKLLVETHFSVRVNARFYPCCTEDDGICAADGSFALPMLRDAKATVFGDERSSDLREGERLSSPASLADFFPAKASGQTAPLGLFAISVSTPEQSSKVSESAPDAQRAGQEDDLLLHALKAMLAEAASSWLQHTLESSLSTAVSASASNPTAAPVKVILPGIGYACCPDHSLKRDVLHRLDPGLGITLSESCAMLPVESICGFVIAAPNAHFPEIRHISPASLAAYARKRGFTPEENALFLSHLK